MSTPTRPLPPSSPRSAKWGPMGPLGSVIIWLVALGLLYAVFLQTLKPKPMVTLPGGVLVIPMARDGHFYAEGTVAGQPARFLVDTGATLVVVSEALARQAGLTGGMPTVFKTANGDLQGRIHLDVPVTLGPAQVTAVRVGVGLVGLESDQALLGQSFLSKFDITLNDRQMTLRPKAD